MILGIDHVDFVVNDLDEFEAFYVALGFEVVRRTEHEGAALKLQHPGENQPILELHPASQPDGTTHPLGLRHLAFRVDDIHEAFEAFKAKGLTVEYEPMFWEETGRWLAAFFDPDGRKVQLVGSHSSKATE